ncbi:MAG TPA: glucosyl-3-phosphoglycerate synthase [Acidimicrobiales bacterium]
MVNHNDLRPDNRPSRMFHWRDFDARDLARAKGDQTISVCIPAHDEAATVGDVVRILVRTLVARTGLVDEVVVVDDHSTDRTAEVAAAAGARVVHAADVLPDVAGGPGKGEALWRSLHVARGDIVVWCDADITDFGARFVVGLVGPLLTRPDIEFVKGFYDRPTASGDSGGRVTELMARPLLATLFPHLATILQPLSGEYAGRRSLLERLPFVRGYGVDLGLLIDIAELAGPEVIAQSDLGTRRHRNRHLDELGPQALTVLQTGLQRAGVAAADPALLLRPGRDPLAATFGEMPPLAALLTEA